MRGMGIGVKVGVGLSVLVLLTAVHGMAGESCLGESRRLLIQCRIGGCVEPYLKRFDLRRLRRWPHGLVVVETGKGTDRCALEQALARDPAVMDVRADRIRRIEGR